MTMRKYGLIGYPLGHSFSMAYFAEKFRKEGIEDCSYENYPLPDIGLLPELISGQPELCGLNVTIPYKSRVFRYIDVFDPEALEVGAVNVLKISRAGGDIRISGFNSDITGITDSILPYTGRGLTKALVLGTGGSSRAVCHVLKKFGITVVVYEEVDEKMMSEVSLIVNTTPLGMYPDTGSRPDINYGLLGSSHLLFDLVYNPEYTLFLRSGMERGCTVITGIGMLHSQAERSWQIWNDDNL
jgi:shikimate dehydrogenase